MIVNSKLLEKYHNGFCTKEEQDCVEKWLASEKFDDNEFLNLPISESKEEHKIKIWQNISKEINKPVIKVIPIYKKLVRYISVACFISAVFAAGRFSTSIDNIASETNTRNLLVYGGNGTYAKIPGNEFSLQFDGQLKLYNGSSKTKTVEVGNKIYSLQPMQTYILMGDNQNSSLIVGLDFEIEQGDYGELKGDFSIKILKA